MKTLPGRTLTRSLSRQGYQTKVCNASDAFAAVSGRIDVDRRPVMAAVTGHEQFKAVRVLRPSVDGYALGRGCETDIRQAKSSVADRQRRHPRLPLVEARVDFRRPRG